MDRRDFLKMSGLLMATGVCPQLLAQSLKQNKILILLELKGGNDGLNTLVPFRDESYLKLRPRLALKEGEVLPLSESLGLHHKLKFLRDQFQKNELAIVQSVGYESPNLSHFRSIDIWETASPSDEFLYEGWVAKALSQLKLRDSISKGVVLGDFNLGPLRGSSSDILVIDNPNKMAKSGGLISNNEFTGKNKALAHILKVENQLNNTLSKISSRAKQQQAIALNKKGGKLNRDVSVLLQILGIDANVPFFKLSLGGFDTHTGQKNKHANLMGQLDEGLQNLVQGIKQLGLWERTLIMTYSEFGRRPKENANQGTDHGTANCHFIMGGKVRSGLYGTSADLKNLQGNNLVATMDFKDLYQTILSKWWGSSIKLAPGQKTLNFLG